MWLRRGSVDRRDGSPRNNGPELLEPIATLRGLGADLVRGHAGQSSSAMLRDSQRDLHLAVLQLKREAKIHGLTG